MAITGSSSTQVSFPPMQLGSSPTEVRFPPITTMLSAPLEEHLSFEELDVYGHNQCFWFSFVLQLFFF